MDRLRALSDQNAALAAEANAARQQFADFAHMASDWLWETDTAHCIRYSAGRFPVESSTRNDGICGMPLLDTLKMREEDLDLLRNAMEKRQTYERVMARFELPSRDTLILQLSATPRFDEAGNFLGYRGVGHDITTRLRAEEQIRHFANHDALTGLQNRRAFTAMMADIDMDPNARALVLLLDLDGFKGINDEYGHDCGDRLLQQVAQRLTSCLRRDDKAFRLGGDEFAVVIQGNGATLETAERLGAAIVAQFAAPITGDEGVQVAVGGSIGAARLGPLSPNTDDMFKHADLALYAAKADGGSRYRIYTEEFAAKNERRRDLEAALRLAIDEERLEVQFQPQHRLSDGAVVGFEALARWTDPNFGKVSPGDFIPIAERSGLIRSLDRLIMQKAIRAACDWPVCPVTGVVPRLCVNVSAVQVLDENFAFAVDHMIKAAGFDPSRLEIELTESVLVQDNELAARVMDQLRALGAVLAIDDFGTGYSSLGYLSRFPLDRLKIDRAFVMRIDQPNNLTITRSIAQLAFSLGLEVVAEGIESEEQMTTLRRLGVHIGQGFLFSRAIHEKRVASYIRTNKVRPAPLPEPARLSA
jgi:diguanylate cyclase (GGDEF)-like protein